jgi:hypothetical protein
MILLHPERLAAGVPYEVNARVGTPGVGKDTGGKKGDRSIITS